MRFVLFLSPLLALAACGGGGGTATQTAALQGMVYEVNGQTLDRAGVTVRVLETGQVATTGADGRFFFGRVPADAFTLDFGGGLAALAQSGPGGGGGADDPMGDDNGGGSGGQGADDPPGDDNGIDLTEDDSGNPQVGGVPAGDTVEVLVAVQDGQVTEMSVSCGDRVRAEARLTRAADAPDADVQGKVRVESRADREKLTIEAEHLDPGTVVDFVLDGVSIGTGTADTTGEAQLELNTKDGDTLPLGVASVADLAGLPVEVLLDGTLLLSGEVPALPDATVTPGNPGSGIGSGRGRAPLTPLVSGLEGHVEIRQRLDTGEQRFKMEAQNLAPGAQVAFWIEDLANPGTFVKLRSVVADAGGQAEINTQDGLPMPLGVADVSLLAGLGVKVTLDDGSGQVLLEGIVPSLVTN
ncbi:MAG TPA: hypothetical protein VFY93_12975 [Planctomycetota bacterium]|nr:hypothetical protein [Planctomycetota bacterium]